MTPLTTYIVKGKNTSTVWEFKYHLNGVFASFEILEGELTFKQKRWLFDFNRFPYSENAIQSWKSINNFQIEVGDPDLSFDSFWKTYGYKVGKKAQTENIWDKMSKSDKIKCLLAIPSYNRYLSRKPGMEKAYPSTYLNQRYYENEYKSAV